jgi:DNA helicase MCM9
MVVLQDDLVESATAGDDVVVTGVVRHMWAPGVRDARQELELFIEANHVETKNDSKAAVSITEALKHEFAQLWLGNVQTPLAARNQLVASVCPQLCSMFLIKLAVLLTLIGGVGGCTFGFDV